MLKNFFYTSILLLLLSCQHVDKNVLPETKLTEEQMVRALIDVAQIKVIKTNYINDFEHFGINTSDYLCKKHDIDSVTLEENLRYYGYHPNDLKQILDKVNDSLEFQKKELKALIKARRKKRKSNEEDEDEEDEDEPYSNISSKVSLKKYAPTDLSKKTRN